MSRTSHAQFLGNGTLTMFSNEEWIEALWARTSAVPCDPNQRVLDKIIPMYFKSLPRESAMAYILISDKAREDAKSCLEDEILRENKTRSSPYTAILTDLGAPSSKLIVRDYMTKTLRLRIYADDLNTTTYPFLEENIATILNKLYDP